VSVEAGASATSLVPAACALPEGRSVVMLCTAARGGMRAVAEGYRCDGLFERYRVELLVTHDEGSAWRRLRMAAVALLGLTGQLWRGRVAMLHSHMAMRGSFWRKALLNSWARLHRVPVIAHLHGSELKQFHAAQPRWRRALIRRELEACARVLVLSQGWANFVRGIAPAARVVELPNYVHMPTFAGMVRASGSVNVLFLGLVGERKGVFDLLPAFAAAVEPGLPLRLTLAGNGDVTRAGEVVSELGLHGSVFLAGWVEGEQKRRLLESSDLYVLPSRNENLPMSVIEAMSYGVPVISTRVGGIPELVRDGVEGVLVDAGDREALTAALVRLGSDAALRARMGVNARQRVKSHYSAEVVLPRLYAVYEDVLAGHPWRRAA
jgi:glycosyltransferase involved in cell wall biosynthesis